MDDLYSVKEWDGLAKIGELTMNNRTITTPALFPVVDPKQQTIPIQDFKSIFGFEQVITSAYLMSKRIGHYNFDQYPLIHEYLDYDGMVMMDSGAYQIMLYGDIELTPRSTITLQKHVQPDIGVILDHPIGYDVSYREAKKRVDTTLANLQETLELISPDDGISWTLPIQGGRHLDLLNDYLALVTAREESEIRKKFSFFALGSVVPVMINQDYSTLVQMITLARHYLPTTYPLHLFGAGHPSMFALATFLGCDSYDSAAYALMAKEGRYMTTNGTYHLQDLREFPCHCPECGNNQPQEVLNLTKAEQMDILSKHNLWVSNAEIKQIRIAIHEGTLWDLVMQRASSVPHLMKATRLAIDMVTKGKLKDKFNLGTPIRKSSIVKLNFPEDINKPSIQGVSSILINTLEKLAPTELILLAETGNDPLFQRIPDSSIADLNLDDKLLLFMVPNIGLVPHSLSDTFPFGQFISELPRTKNSFELAIKELSLINLEQLQKISLIIDKGIQKDQLVFIQTSVEKIAKPNSIVVEVIRSANMSKSLQAQESTRD